MGVNGGQPQVLFEGIPYPFLSSKNLIWLPAYQNFELLNFPSSAWWGPSAAMGAVQIRLPELTSTSRLEIGGWGGLNSIWGGEAGFENSRLSLGGVFQHGASDSFNSIDAFNFILGSQLIADDSFELRTGFLATQWFGSDNWYSFFGSMKWKYADFQSLELKPFIQFADLNGVAVKEFGSDLNYHFIMGGFIESQLGGGMSQDDFSNESVTPPKNNNKEYIQNSDVIDALGDFKINTTFRLDFSNVMRSAFSTSIGSQYRLGDFSILGDYSKTVDPLTLSDVLQGDFGFRYQPVDFYYLTCKLETEMLEGIWWTGGRIKTQWFPEDKFFGLFRKVQLGIEGRILGESSGDQYFFDTVARLQFSIFEPLTFWFVGHELSNQYFYADGGMDCFIAEQTKFYISFENIGNYPNSWPDLTTPKGRVAWLGMETGL